MDTITQMAMALLRSATPVPGSFAGGLVRSLGRRVASLVGYRQRAGWAVSAASEVPGASRPDDPANATHAAPLPRLIADLGLVLDRQLGAEERQLLARLGERASRGEVAEWLGSSHGAERVRVLRLRERLRAAARRHAATLAPDDRVLLERWLTAAPARVPSPSPAGRPAPALRRTARFRRFGAST